MYTNFKGYPRELIIRSSSSTDIFPILNTTSETDEIYKWMFDDGFHALGRKVSHLKGLGREISGVECRGKSFCCKLRISMRLRVALLCFWRFCIPGFAGKVSKSLHFRP